MDNVQTKKGFEIGAVCWNDAVFQLQTASQA